MTDSIIGLELRSTVTKEISLFDTRDAEVIATIAKQATGEKYLINPSLA